MTRETFEQDRASGRADLVEARLGWLTIRAGDVLTRRTDTWTTPDGRTVPAWAIRHHWGSAFVPVGYRPRTRATLLERRARFICRRNRP